MVLGILHSRKPHQPRGRRSGLRGRGLGRGGGGDAAGLRTGAFAAWDDAHTWQVQQKDLADVHDLYDFLWIQ